MACCNKSPNNCQWAPEGENQMAKTMENYMEIGCIWAYRQNYQDYVPTFLV